MQNEKERVNKERHTNEPSRNQDVLFPIPPTRWERYTRTKLNLRNRSGGEVFFERGADGKDIQNLERGANQANRRYDTDGISPTVPTAGGGRHIPMIVGWSKSHRTGKSDADKRRKNYGQIEERVKIGEFNTLSGGQGGGNQSTKNYVIETKTNDHE